jgi:hypothetical protein
LCSTVRVESPVGSSRRRERDPRGASCEPHRGGDPRDRARALLEVLEGAEAAQAATGTPEAEETMRRLLLEIRYGRHNLKDWAGVHGVWAHGRDDLLLAEDRKRGRWWLYRP